MTANMTIVLNELIKPGGELQITRADVFPTVNGPRWKLVVYEPVPGNKYPRARLTLIANTASDLVRQLEKHL